MLIELSESVFFGNQENYFKLPKRHLAEEMHTISADNKCLFSMEVTQISIANG